MLDALTLMLREGRVRSLAPVMQSKLIHLPNPAGALWDVGAR